MDANDPDLESLPSSLVPRWLAALVLVALCAAGLLSAWLILAAPAVAPHSSPTSSPTSSPHSSSAKTPPIQRDAPR